MTLVAYRRSRPSPSKRGWLHELSIVLLLMMATTVPAATYYVSPAGNDSNPGTIDRAWQSLAKVHNTVKSDDIVYFRSGIWSNQYLWPGKTVGITNTQFLAYPGERPMFTGKVKDTNQVRPLHLNGRNRNLLFRGLTWSNNWSVVTMINQEGHVFDDCSFGWMDLDNRLPGGYLYNCVALWSSRYITFTNCTFTRWGDSSTGNDHGIPLAIGSLATDDMYSTNCFGNLITNCRFDRGGHGLIELYAGRNVIRGNTFINPAFMPGPDGTLYGNRHLSTMTWCAEPNLVENNDFSQCAPPVDSPSVVACFDVSSRRLILRRNRAFDNVGVFVSFYAKGYNTSPSENYVYHNSILNVGTSSIAESTGYWWYNRAMNWPHEASQSNRVVNNVIWRVGPKGDQPAFAGPGMASSIFAGNLLNSVDPLFVSTNVHTTSAPDLQLRTGSPAIESGAWLTTITSTNGTGTRFKVADAGYFYDGWGIPGEEGDRIQLAGQSQTAKIVAIDYALNTVTVDRPLSWIFGQGVAQPFSGSAPDIGAHEFPINASSPRPHTNLY